MYVCNCVLYVHCGVLDIVLQFVERVEWFGESDWGAPGSVSVCVWGGGGGGGRGGGKCTVHCRVLDVVLLFVDRVICAPISLFIFPLPSPSLSPISLSLPLCLCVRQRRDLCVRQTDVISVYCRDVISVYGRDVSQLALAVLQSCPLPDFGGGCSRYRDRCSAAHYSAL